MTKPLFDWDIIDSFLTSDEWDHIRYLIESEIKSIEIVDLEGLLKDPLFLLLFEKKIVSKLISAGFKKEQIENPEEFQKVLQTLNDQGREFSYRRFDLHPPYGFPSGAYNIGLERNIYWAEAHIEAALRAFENIQTLRKLLKSKKAFKVYVRTMEMIINLLRSGVLPQMAEAGKKFKREQSIKGGKPRTRDGIPPTERSKRNALIIERFNESRLTVSSFAVNFASEYGLKPRTLRSILPSKKSN